MPDTIHLTVACVICRDDRFLVVREHAADRIAINQPAGHVEPGERLSSAALRETREETGYEIELTGLLGLSTYFSVAAGITYYRVSFAAKLLSDDQKYPLDPEIIEALWLTYDEIKGSDNLRSPMVLADIERYRSGKIYPLEMLHESHHSLSS